MGGADDALGGRIGRQTCPLEKGNLCLIDWLNFCVPIVTYQISETDGNSTKLIIDIHKTSRGTMHNRRLFPVEKKNCAQHQNQRRWTQQIF